MGTLTAAAMFVMTLQGVINTSSVDANGVVAGKIRNSIDRSYSLAQVWSSTIWNRFPGEIVPLFLTPFLKAGKIEEAQKRSRVWNLSEEDVESYSGYITVDTKFHSNMFFWFFPAQTQAEKAPVLLWLNGGPGRSSMVGALLENGPLELRKNGTQLYRRAVSWTKHFSMLYIDNPVGVGYSFTKNTEGLSRTKDDVTRNLYSTLIQFFQLFPQYSHQPFYVGGQSYAGKYVSNLGYHIHQQNTNPRTPRSHLINFKGVYIGAGFCDPEHMVPEFGEYLYHVGFVTDSERQAMKERIHDIFQEWHRTHQPKDTLNYLKMFFSRPSGSIGMHPLDNLLGPQATNDHLMPKLREFLQSKEARVKLHVGYAQNEEDLTQSIEVARALNADILLNTNTENGFLMDRYKVLHYSGNLDVIVSVPMTEAFLRHVQWAGQEEYRLHTRQPWWVGRDVAGWVAVIRNFTRVIIHNSGHMAPYDQPEWTLAMMKNFIFDQPFFETDQKD